MFLSRRLLAAATAVGFISLCTPAMAQQDAAAQDPDTMTVGVGVASVPRYEGSDKSRILPIPQVRGKVSNYSFWTRGLSLYFDAIPDDNPSGVDFELGPVVGARLDRTRLKTIKQAQVEALGKKDAAIEVGGFVGIGKTGIITSAYDNLSARVAITKDVAGAHESIVVTPQIEYFTPLSVRSFVGIGLSADYVGKKFGRYYFDVSPEQSLASGLRVYDRAGDKAGFRRVGASLAGGYSLSGDIRRGWALFGAVNYSRLLGRYADSPIVADVGSRNQFIAALGVGYTF